MRGLRIVAMAAILLVPAQLALAQEEMPVIVNKPVVEITTFTNWQEIKITYTIGWHDGYDIVFDNSHPERMNFGDFEIDPIRGRRFIQINERKVGQANYTDLVYYLRHISPKMKPIEPRKIPEQVFYFRCPSCEPGKPADQLPLEEIKSSAIILNYVTVLTPDAGDIKDRIDFGSFSQQAVWLKGMGIFIFVAFSCLAIYILFRRPTGVASVPDQSFAPDQKPEAVIYRPERAMALSKFLRVSKSIKDELAKPQTDHKKALADFSNELQSLILSFVPSAQDSDVTSDILTKLSKLRPSRLANIVYYLTGHLDLCDKALDSDGYINLERTIEDTGKLAGRLKRRHLFWYAVLEKRDSVVAKIKGVIEAPNRGLAFFSAKLRKILRRKP